MQSIAPFIKFSKKSNPYLQYRRRVLGSVAQEEDRGCVRLNRKSRKSMGELIQI